MKKKLSRWGICALAVVSVCAGAYAKGELRLTPIAGKIVHFNRSTGVLHLQNEKGSTWIVQMQPGSKYEKFHKTANASAFREGEMVSIGISGSFTANPKQGMLMVDWGTSGDYVAKTAAAPYTTRVGDFATTGGVASANNMGAQRPDTTVGVLGHGGTLPPPNLDNPNGTQQSVNGSPQGQQPQGLNGTNLSTRGAWMQPMQNMGVDPFSTGASGTSLFDSNEDGGGGAGRVASATGTPVNIQAVVVQAAPGGRSLVVQQAGSNQKLNVMVGGNINLAALRPGQSVTIIGNASPHGFIEAQQVIPAP